MGHVVLSYRARQKSKPLGKIRYLWNCSRPRFFLQIYIAYRLQSRIQATHCANFVAIFGCVQTL